MEDHRLKAFCLVVEMKSFSRAAEAKFMTQSAMSHLIRNLEEELGMKLLSRLGKTVTPTAAGRLFYKQAKSILDQYDRMENSLYELVEKVKGPLHIGASNTATTYVLPQVLYGFSKKYPEVSIEISSADSETIIGLIEGGRIDLGIVEGKIRNRDVWIKDIAEDEIVIIASDANPLAGKKKPSAGSLLNQPFIMPEAGSGSRECIDDFFHAAGIDPDKLRIVMTAANPELIIRMVQAGMGISFVSKWSVFKAVKEGSIRLLDFSDRKLKRKFHLVGLDGEPSGMAAKSFADFIREYRFFEPF